MNQGNELQYKETKHERQGDPAATKVERTDAEAFRQEHMEWL